MANKAFVQRYSGNRHITTFIYIDEDWTSNQVFIRSVNKYEDRTITLLSTEQVEYVRDQLTAILTEWKRLDDGLNELAEISQKAGLYE